LDEKVRGHTPQYPLTQLILTSLIVFILAVWVAIVALHPTLQAGSTVSQNETWDASWVTMLAVGLMFAIGNIAELAGFRHRDHVQVSREGIQMVSASGKIRKFLWANPKWSLSVEDRRQRPDGCGYPGMYIVVTGPTGARSGWIEESTLLQLLEASTAQGWTVRRHNVNVAHGAKSWTEGRTNIIPT
jgi:hypothetical protein